jgi:hypothetical protein
MAQHVQQQQQMILMLAPQQQECGRLLHRRRSAGSSSSRQLSLSVQQQMPRRMRMQCSWLPCKAVQMAAVVVALMAGLHYVQSMWCLPCGLWQLLALHTCSHLLNLQ